MFRLLVSSILLLASSCLAFCQKLDKEYVKSVSSADEALYFGNDFETAAKLYKEILSSHPDNANIQAKLGNCYLYLDGKQKEALTLFKSASTKIVARESEYEEAGEKASLDTYIYLANAYQMNDSLEQAIVAYKNAAKKLKGLGLFRDDYFDKQIENCEYAIAMQREPGNVTRELFTSWLEKYPGACNPVISANDSVFAFTQVVEGENKIFCSYKKETWQEPIEITKQLGGNRYMFTNSINHDGTMLVFNIDINGDGNLFYSVTKKDEWTKIKSFGKAVNTIYWEAHGFITPDGNTLYFASNREGGQGDLDIWVSKKGKDGSWQTANNCGRRINTAYDEDTPYFDTKTNTLIFSSMGHKGMGNYDIFSSTMVRSNWSEPTTLPYPINNTLANTFFIPYDASTKFVTSLYDEENQKRNIYSLSYLPYVAPLAVDTIVEPIIDQPVIVEELVAEVPVEMPVITKEDVNIVEPAKEEEQPRIVTPTNRSYSSPRITTYTIQVMATRKRVDLDYFKNLGEVKEILGNDGYYRYVWGTYSGFSATKDDIATARSKGYTDAFIRDVNKLPGYNQ